MQSQKERVGGVKQMLTGLTKGGGGWENADNG